MAGNETKIRGKQAWVLHGGTPQEKADFVNGISATSHYAVYEARELGVVLIGATEVCDDLSDGPVDWDFVGFMGDPYVAGDFEA